MSVCVCVYPLQMVNYSLPLFSVPSNPVVLLVKEIDPPAVTRKNAHSTLCARPPQVQEVEKPAFPGKLSRHLKLFQSCAELVMRTRKK